MIFFKLKVEQEFIKIKNMHDTFMLRAEFVFQLKLQDFNSSFQFKLKMSRGWWSYQKWKKIGACALIRNSRFLHEGDRTLESKFPHHSLVAYFIWWRISRFGSDWWRKMKLGAWSFNGVLERERECRSWSDGEEDDVLEWGSDVVEWWWWRIILLCETLFLSPSQPLATYTLMHHISFL